MLYLQIESPKSSVLNFLDSNSFEVIISIFQRTEKVPDMERLPDDNGGTPNGDAPAGEVPSGEKSDDQAPDGEKPTGEAPDGQKPEKDMLDEMTLTLSGDTMTITVNDDTIITIDGTDATLDDLQVGDTVSFFLDGEVVTSLSVGMPEPTQPGRSMQAPEQK